MKSSSQHRLFLHHKLICIPTYDRPDSICDFVWQTANGLATQNVVIILALGENWRGKVGWQEWISSLSKIGNTNGIIKLGLFQFIPLQRLSWLRQINDTLNFWLLAMFFERWSGGRTKLLWIFHPNQSTLLSSFKDWTVHYDCVDWHTAVTPKENERLNQQRTQLLAAASTITTLTLPVQARIQRLSGKLPPIVPQGFDIQGLKETQPLPPALQKRLVKLKKKPLIGFFGGINQRLDVKLLEELTQSSPTWQFLFVGSRGTDQNVDQSEAGEARLDALLKRSNVIQVQSLHRTQLLELMHACDVLIIPYDLQWEFNVCCFPMKVMEYFYAGPRIVSTPIPSLLTFKSLILLADTAVKFRVAIQHALDTPFTQMQKKMAREIAECQTWEKKLNSVDVYLNKMLRSS